jgi:hypothetical protein
MIDEVKNKVHRDIRKKSRKALLRLDKRRQSTERKMKQLIPNLEHYKEKCGCNCQFSFEGICLRCGGNKGEVKK